MESGSGEQGRSSGVPRGGPIYLPNMVGPLTTIPDFQSSFLHLLQDLEACLSPDSSSSSQNYDVSTDTLKIYTEEELTDMAMKEAFQEDDHSQHDVNQPSQSFHLSDHDRKDESDKNIVLDNSGRMAKNSSSFGPSSGHPSAGSRKKKKKRTEKKSEEAFIAKVEQLAKIKRKQDEDKLTVSLHCLNSTCKSDEGATSSSEGIEKMESLRSTNYITKPMKPSDVQEPVAMLFPEVVLCIEIYNNNRKSKTQEFLVLGRQMLTELKDKIYCLTDQVMKKAGQYDPSGYFLIEDIFCNDLRDPSAIDYSKPILDWLGSSKDEALRKWECILTGELLQKQKAVLGDVKPTDLPSFRAVDMHRTRFCDLRFRLGAGYLYCHQGDCKHMIVIRDMRLIHPEDNHNRGAYPRVIFQQKSRVQKCSVCRIYRASKMAVDDKWAKENPCYFCEYCYSLLHSEEGPLHSDFPVYDYLHE